MQLAKAAALEIDSGAERRSGKQLISDPAFFLQMPIDPTLLKSSSDRNAQNARFYAENFSFLVI